MRRWVVLAVLVGVGLGLTFVLPDRSSTEPVASVMLPADPARATVETAAWPGGPYPYDGGDVADDSAIYADPDDPARSVVIADNKSDGSGSSEGGIGVFGMDGSLRQFIRAGRIGNVDLRLFDFASGSRVLVGANRRDDSTLRFWVLDPESSSLSGPVEDGTLPTEPDNYGFCLGYPQPDQLHAYVLHTGGTLEQFRIRESDEPGKVTADLVRTLDVGGQAEGCVVDDDNGFLYVAEEDEGIWRYPAAADDHSSRTKVAAVGNDGLTADVEGLALLRGQDASSGYLLASSQGSSRIHAYDRVSGELVGSFEVRGSGDVDDVSETDGIDASSADLGPGFRHGALVVHDHDNSGGPTSNLKLVPLAAAGDRESH